MKFLLTTEARDSIPIGWDSWVCKLWAVITPLKRCTVGETKHYYDFLNKRQPWWMWVPDFERGGHAIQWCGTLKMPVAIELFGKALVRKAVDKPQKVEICFKTKERK